MIIKSIMTDEDRKALEYMLSLEYAMPYQLLKIAGSNRRTGCTWKIIQTADGGFRCNSSVCGSIWSVRRRYSFADDIIRFYFYGEGHKRTFCECTEYTG